MTLEKEENNQNKANPSLIWKKKPQMRAWYFKPHVPFIKTFSLQTNLSLYSQPEAIQLLKITYPVLLSCHVNVKLNRIHCLHPNTPPSSHSPRRFFQENVCHMCPHVFPYHSLTSGFFHPSPCPPLYPPIPLHVFMPNWLSNELHVCNSRWQSPTSWKPHSLWTDHSFCCNSIKTKSHYHLLPIITCSPTPLPIQPQNHWLHCLAYICIRFSSEPISP